MPAAKSAARFALVRNTAATTLAVAALYWLVGFYADALRDPRFLDGWVLAAGMFVQLLFHFRKKLPALLLGRAASWLKAHIYGGYFVIAAFIFHCGFSLPDILFEWILAGLFAIVALSGVIGMYLSRAIPARLQERGLEQVTLEHIPALRRELAREVDALVVDAVEEARAPAISDFYATRLRAFFARPQNLTAHLCGSKAPLKQLCAEIDELENHAAAPGKKTLNAIRRLVTAKDNLDHQQAFQGLLQTWLFIHIPATYCLILLSVLHVAVVYAFVSGAR